MLKSNLTVNVLKDYANFNILGFTDYVSGKYFHMRLFYSSPLMSFHSHCDESWELSFESKINK